jgi:hypothetical protein
MALIFGIQLPLPTGLERDVTTILGVGKREDHVPFTGPPLGVSDHRGKPTLL